MSFSNSPRNKDVVKTLANSYDTVTKKLNLSNGVLQSVLNPNRYRMITAETLLTYISMADIDICDIRYLDISRCKLVDEDILILAYLIINSMESIEQVDLSDNWIGLTVGAMKSEPTSTNPCVKAIKRLLKWNVDVNLAKTEFERPEYVILLENLT